MPDSRRLTLQATLDAGKTQAERNRLGQFATPAALAQEIVAHSLTLMPAGMPVRFLDPAFGTGAFFSALLESVPASRIAAARGVEIDPHYGIPAAALWAEAGLHLTAGDFTALSPPPVGARATLLLCNPPYVRHHHIAKPEKGRLQAAARGACGLQLSGLAGLYAYFLVLAHPWMEAGGLGVWLIPSEFMDVNYGAAVREYLLSRVTLLRLHRFDPAEVQFGDALVSSAVVWVRNSLPPPQHEILLTFGGTVAHPRERRLTPATALTAAAKWTRASGPSPGKRLGDFFTIRRGLATGDNGFFIMTAAEAARRGVPESMLRPVLPGPRFIPGDEIRAGADGVPLLDRCLFLLDCPLGEAEVQAHYPGLWAYLQSGVPQVSGRYLCSHRSPWYRQENRPAPPFLCTYMGRRGSGTAEGKAPFRLLRNHSRATATNVYLLFYPKPKLSQALACDAGLGEQVWGALRALPSQTLVEEGREYGGGLHKLEPRELEAVPAGGLESLLATVSAGLIK